MPFTFQIGLTISNKLVKKISSISAEWLGLLWISDLVKLTAKISDHILNKIQARREGGGKGGKEEKREGDCLKLSGETCRF